jgi:hypothetical protein
LPPVEALGEPRGDQGMFERARSNPRLVIAIAIARILVLAWIGWAIYVTSSNGASAGLGVVIAWPAMLAALALIALPIIGVYLLIRRLAVDSGTPGEADPDDAEPDASSEEQAEGEDQAEGEGEDEQGPAGEESQDAEGPDDDQEPDDDEEQPEPEATTSSKKG